MKTIEEREKSIAERRLRIKAIEARLAEHDRAIEETLRQIRKIYERGVSDRPGMAA